MSLEENLKSAKEKAIVTEFDVIITEILHKKVTVKATSREEAEEIVNEKWKNSKIVLDANNFSMVSFKAKKHKVELARGDER